MKLIRGLHNIKGRHAPCVTTIGSFDGMHLGHLALFKLLKQKSKQYRLPSLLISFVPNPKHYFGKHQAQLSNFRTRFLALEGENIDECLLIYFNRAFANLEAHAFVKNILIKKLNVHYLLVGDDFRFGKSRSGDGVLLKTLAQKYRFEIDFLKGVFRNKLRISSSRIRMALELGDFKTAEALLGKPFSIIGRVGHGEKKGRIIGFPTLNIALKNLPSPVLGIFAVKVLIQSEAYLGVASVGKNPTVGGEKTQLEVFVLDFNAQIYGAVVEVRFYTRIRAERYFSNLELLKAQIKEDIKYAQKFFEYNSC